MAGARPNRKSGKLLRFFEGFSKGLNTASAAHQIEDEEFYDGFNVDIGEQGAISKRRGYSPLPAGVPGTVQGMFMFKSKDKKNFVVVAGGKLYRLNTGENVPQTLLKPGTWEPIPVRLYKPGNVEGALTTVVTANFESNSTYEYRVAAKDASGKTLMSDPTIKGVTNVSRVTQGGTRYNVKLTWAKVLGATSYDIYRSKTKPDNTLEGLLRIASVLDVDTYTDNGGPASAVDPNPPVANTTSYTLSSADASFVAWNDRLYLTCGNGLVYWDGTNAQLAEPYYPTNDEIEIYGTNAYADAASSIHKCRFVKIHWDRLFLAGDSEFPQNVYFTYLGLSPGGGTKAYFQGSNAFDVTTDNNEPITGMHNFRDALVFFTRSSIHTLFGKQPDPAFSEAFVLRPTNHSVGCESHKSIAIVHNGLVFVSRAGIYALINVTASDTNMNVRHLSAKIEPTFKAIKEPGKAVAVFHDLQYKVCFPAEGVTLRWYADKGAWTIDRNLDAVGMPAQGFNYYLTWDNDLYQGTPSMISKMGVKALADGTEVDFYNDNNVPVALKIRTKSFDVDHPLNMKKFREGVVMSKQFKRRNTINLEMVVDYTHHIYLEDVELNEAAILGAWELGKHKLGWVDVVYTPFDCRSKGRQVYFVITNNSTDEPIVVYGIGLEYKIKPM